MEGYKIRSTLRKSPSNEQEAISLLELLTALKEEIVSYRWSISDAELWPLPSDSEADIDALLLRASQGVLWLSGLELYHLAAVISVSNWGAFLAFEPIDADFTYLQVPYSEGRPPSIQHPKAVIEIQAVDGEYFEIFTRKESLRLLILRHFNVDLIDSTA